MPRSVRARIETRSARLRLPARKDPYYHTLEPGLAIGYHRPRKGAGTWWARVRINNRYMVEAIATADDYSDDDGSHDWARAQAAARAWAGRQAGGGGQLTVAEAVAAYLSDLRARRGERAAAGEAGRLRKHLLPALGDRRVADLTDHDLRSWRNKIVPVVDDEERVRRGRDTANRVWSIAKAALNLAFKSGRVADDRAWRRVDAFKNVGEARKVVLTPAELQRLIEACPAGLRELVAVGAQTGARLGELTSARVRDLDLEAGTLRVNGKTGAREIHLAPATLMLLRRAASGRRADERLLPPPDRPSWSKNLHNKRLQRAVRAAGLDPATCFYSLRHSYISHALKSLIPVKAVADHCGTSMAMIERHYAKFVVADKARYAEVGAIELRVDAGTSVIPLRPGA